MKAMYMYLVEQAAEALKKRRIALGLKQSDVASMAGISLSTLRKFEQKGGISLERFFKLCHVYKMENQIVAALEQRDFWTLEQMKRADLKRIVR